MTLSKALSLSELLNCSSVKWWFATPQGKCTAIEDKGKKSLKDRKQCIRLNQSELVRAQKRKEIMLPNRVTEGEVNKRTIDKGVGRFEDTDKG